MKFPKTYHCLPSFTGSTTDDILIIPIRFDDRIPIRKWRNDQTFHLRQQGLISEEHQDEYFKHVVFPLFHKEHPSQLLFSIFRKGLLVGYGGLVHTNWNDKYTELSFLTKTEILEKNHNEYKRIFSIFISTMKSIVFEHLKFKRIFTETYSLRKEHIKILESNGFLHEGTHSKKILINGKYYDSLFHSILKVYER